MRPNRPSSIKAVLPVLTGHSYTDLEMQEGGQASLGYLRVHFGEVPGAERQNIRGQLERYYGQDTEGIVWIVDVLARLAEVEAAFKNLKGDLAIRPIFHQKQARIEAHIFVAFLAYCVHVSLRQQLRAQAPGLTVRQVLEKFAAIEMLDVHFPTGPRSSLLLKLVPSLACRAKCGLFPPIARQTTWRATQSLPTHAACG